MDSEKAAATSSVPEVSQSLLEQKTRKGTLVSRFWKLVIREVRLAYKQRTTKIMDQISEEFHIPRSAVYDIVMKRTWKESHEAANVLM